MCIEGSYSPLTSCHLILCATLLIKYDHKDLSPPCDAPSSLIFFTLLYFKLKNWLLNCLAVKCFYRRCQDLSAVSALPCEICLPCPWLINTIVMPAPYILYIRAEFLPGNEPQFIDREVRKLVWDSLPCTALLPLAQDRESAE